MADWKNYKDLGSWAIIPFDQSINRGLGPWNFTKQGNKPTYNEGTYISSVASPLWEMGNLPPVPITSNHIPCGYWPKELPSAPYIVTSKLYPIETSDYIDSDYLFTDGVLRTTYHSFIMNTEAIDSAGCSISAGTLRTMLHEYIIPTEAVESSGSSISSGTLRNLLHEYVMPTEAADSSGCTLASGTLKTSLISYTMVPEGAESSGATLTGGSLG